MWSNLIVLTLLYQKFALGIDTNTNNNNENEKLQTLSEVTDSVNSLAEDETAARRYLQVEDFGRYLDSEVDSPTIVVDISEVTNNSYTNDTLLDFLEDYEESKLPKNPREASYAAYSKYPYLTPQHGWQPIALPIKPHQPLPVLFPLPQPNLPPKVVSSSPKEDTQEPHYTINYHEDPEYLEDGGTKHTFFVDEVVPPSEPHLGPAVIPGLELLPNYPVDHHHHHGHHHHHIPPHKHPIAPHYPHVNAHHYPHLHGYPAVDTYTTQKPDDGPPRSYFPSPNIPGLLVDEGATKLLELLEDVDMKDKLAGDGPYTLFAPTNKAFDKLDPNLLSTLTKDKELLRSVLEYHIISRKLYSKNFLDDTVHNTILDGNQIRLSKDPCGGATINGAEIIMKRQDQTASNGVVHFIDDVIYPIPEGSLPLILSKDKRFAAFSDAIVEVDLETRLNSTGPFTVFAPIDAAFDSLPKSTLEMLAEDKEAMTNLVLRHIINGSKMSPSLTHGDFTSLAKSTIIPRVKKGKVLVNDDANIIDGDIMGTNGVIHVIDKVLL